MKKTAITLLKVGVSIALYAYIFSKVDIAHLWSIIRETNISYFIGAVLVYFCIQALSAYRWRLLLEPLGMKTAYSKLVSFYLLGMYFNFFLPTAIGGDVVRVYYLNKETRRLSGSTASVFLDRDLGMAALLVMAIVAATLAGTSFNGMPLAPIFGLIGVAFLAANMALFYRPSYNLLHRVLKLFKMKRADEKVHNIFESVNSYRGKWSLLSGAMIISLIIQLGNVIANVLLAYAIGLYTRNGWGDFLVFIPAIGLISMVPVSLNGMGWREISYLVLFQSVGATEPQALTLALMWLAVLVITSLPGGVIYVLRGSKKDRMPSGEPLEAVDGADNSYKQIDGNHFTSLAGQSREEESVPTA